MTDRHTLENLHKKAQELLNLGSISSTSSDSSISSLEKVRTIPKKDKKVNNSPIRISNLKLTHKPEPQKPNQINHISGNTKINTHKITKSKVGKAKTDKNEHITKAVIENIPLTTSGRLVNINPTTSMELFTLN